MPIADAFLTHPASLQLGHKLYAIKISASEAYEFKSDFKNFTSMANKYGWDNKLQEGESYEGFLAVYYEPYLQMAVYMEGTLYKVTPDEEVSPEDRNALHQNKLWKVVTGINEDEEGSFNHVFGLNDFNLGHVIEICQKYDKLFLNLDPALLSASIKSKLIAALIDETAAELSDAEAEVVLECFGRDCSLFVEV